MKSENVAAPVPAKTASVLLSFRVMLAFGLALIGILTIINRFNDPDLWFHLKLGQVIWDSHSIPTTDTFSFTTHGHAWTAHEWLAEVGIYGVYRLGGYQWLMAAFSVLTSLLLVLVYVLCYRTCGNALVAFMGGVCGWFFATVGLSIRPLLIGHIFLVIELIVLEIAWQGRRRVLWFLPPLFAIWVNCHGSYFFGLGVLFAYTLASFCGGNWGLISGKSWDPSGRRLLAAILILSAAALCVNPVGVHLLIYPLNVMFQQSVGTTVVEEWQAPDLRSATGIGMIAALIAVFMIALLRRAEIQIRELLTVGAALALASQHSRVLFIFGIMVSPVLCRLAGPVLGREHRKELPIANAILIAAFVAIIAANFPRREDLERQVREKSPVAAVEFIRRAQLNGPMLNEYMFGDYLIWALPEHKVFIDGRGDVYDWTGVFAEMARWAMLKEDPELLLNRYRIGFCILAKESAMTQVLPHLAGWRQAYADKVAVVFVR